jgi:hypothetical protein
MIDFPDEALMSAGLDVWPFELADGAARRAILDSCQVVDGRLARRLSVELNRRIEFFLTPTEAPEVGSFLTQANIARHPMPFTRFPNWYFCPRCRVLKHLAWNTQSEAESLKCSNKGRRVEGKGEPCGDLSMKRRPLLSPVRFVAACENGHIMDFPWSGWAHSLSDKDCASAHEELYLYSTPAAGLAGVVVGCARCGSSRSMAGAFQQDALRSVLQGSCPGDRPWLGPSGREMCNGAVPQTIQRGASNAYFAKVVSSILIPPHSAKIEQVLDRPDIWREIRDLPLVDGKPYEKWLRTKAANLGVDADSFIRAVEERLAAERRDSGQGLGKAVSDTQYRHDEYHAYTGPRPPHQERHDFDTEVVPPQRYDSRFEEFFEQVVLVKKLRETRVLTGFSRIIPVEALNGLPAQLSLTPKTWLPGFCVRGEGIFLQFNESNLSRWAAQPDVADRAKILRNRMSAHRSNRGLEDRPLSAELILIHTLAHLLIRQLAFECGYDSSSIRERLYVSSEKETRMAGLLLYTASGDSEGTLGGLVRQGEPGRLDKTLVAALRNAAICSSDPLCIESTGQGTHALNLAACHACALLPETSCEEGNLLLDRRLVLGSPDNAGIGFFNLLAN